MKKEYEEIELWCPLNKTLNFCFTSKAWFCPNADILLSSKYSSLIRNPHKVGMINTWALIIISDDSYST